MATSDFTTTIVVEQTPREVFNAVNNVRGWWSENIEGGTEKRNDEFIYSFRDDHRCQIKLTEVLRYKKVVWHVMDNYFSFTEDKTEWTGTNIEFEITEEGNRTQLRFTHRGLVPEFECYEVCFNAWTGYITDSLRNLITTGKGQPNPKEERTVSKN